MITNNEINKYIKDIKKQLLYGTKESRQFLKDLKQSITAYAEENQDADMVQVTEQFGKPEDIAATFFEQYNKEEIKKKINIRNIVATCFAVMILLFTVTMVIVIIDNHNEKSGYTYIGPAQEIELIEGMTISTTTQSK